MKRSNLIIILFLLLFTFSCKVAVKEEAVAFDLQLTETEKENGLMSPEILWKFNRLGGIEVSPDGQTVLYTLTSYDLETEERITNIYSVPVNGGEAQQLTTAGGSSPRWFMQGSKIAYTSGGKLYTMQPDGSKKSMVSGLDNFESYSISPAGDKIMFTRRVKLDQTPNEKHNLPMANMRIIDDLMYRHWNYWSDYSYSHIFIAGFNGKGIDSEMDIMEGQRFEAPTAPNFDDGEIRWSPDGTRIAYTSKHLTGREDAVSTNTDIFVYDIAAATVTNLTEANKGFDKYPVFSPDGSMVAWLSMKEDGYESDLDRLFIANLETGEQKWLSEGWDYNIQDVNWTADGGMIYFASPYRGTTQIFSIDISSREINQVSSGKFDFGPVILADNNIITGIQSMSMALEIANISLVDGAMTQVTNVNGHIYDYVTMGETEERYIKTKDNKDLQMWIIYPPDFDPSKKYPALLYCKGGPQGALGQGWSYRWNYQMMAANGYIVVAPNRRGNSGFGSYWREEISGDYGGLNMQDYLDAIDYMAAEPFVDDQRLGAVGASYGGYSVFWLAGMHEGRFKAFISHCGMYNIESWYGSTEELWFPNKDVGGPYWENPKPKGYKYSPHLNVDKWDTPILIITGEHDYRIPFTQSMEAFTAAQLRGVPSRLLFFHDGTHFVTKPQDAVIWQREFFEWLDKYLK